MNALVAHLRNAARTYRLKTDDMELLRAQFGEFVRLIPLLYGVLAVNILAVMFVSRHIPAPLLTDLLPLAYSSVCIARAVWWWRRKYTDMPDADIIRHMRNTSTMAGTMAAAIVGWIVLLYPMGSTTDQGHFVFFIAMTLIACVFCLMPVRSAALSVASIGMVPTIAYFGLANDGRMWLQATILALVGFAMIVVLNRYNRSFAQLIHSQRDLRIRHLETERLSEENRQIALTDALSGLPNRRSLIARLEDVRARSLQGPVNVAMLFVDLDGFKQINDTFGHELGDLIIRQVSREFARMMPADAVLFRMGGDEFAILLEGPSAIADAAGVASTILDGLALPFRLSPHEFQLGASIGIAGSHETELDPYELLRRADTAMYRAKAEGGASAHAYTPEMDKGRTRRQQIENDMRAGLDRGEFDVHYQPLVDAASGNIVAVEALARWPGRTGEPLGPEEFIPVAESSGLIHALGLFVFRRACRQLKAHGSLRLNVNVSPAQFRHPHFETNVVQILKETGFPPKRLQIEITEGYLIDNPDRANRAIASFTAMGVRVALDDFGSGFASIGYLRQFPFSGIKIDKSLAARLGDDPKASLLITGMVHLAKGLDMFVTAEGIETERQATMYRLAGCHELQGFHFGVPSPLHEIEGLLAKSAA